MALEYMPQTCRVLHHNRVNLVLWKPITDGELKGVISLIADMRKVTEPTVFIIEENWYLRIRRHVGLILRKPDIPKHLITILPTKINFQNMKQVIQTIMSKPAFKDHDYRVIRRPNGVPKISHEEAPPPKNSVMFPG